MFSFLSAPLNGKTGTLYDTNYHWKADLGKLQNYGSDTSYKHLVSSFQYIDWPGKLKDNSGYAKRLN
jgi:hypothetical protein